MENTEGEDLNHTEHHFTDYKVESNPEPELNNEDVSSHQSEPNSPAELLQNELAVEDMELGSIPVEDENREAKCRENENETLETAASDEKDPGIEHFESSLIDKTSDQSNDNGTEQPHDDSEDVNGTGKLASSIKADQSEEDSVLADQSRDVISDPPATEELHDVVHSLLETGETDQTRDKCQDVFATNKSLEVSSYSFVSSNIVSENGETDPPSEAEAIHPSDMGLSSVHVKSLADCNDSTTDTSDGFSNSDDAKCQRLPSFDIGPSGEKQDNSSFVNISSAVAATEGNVLDSKSQCNSNSANDSSASSANVSTVYTDDEPSRTTAEFVSCGNEDSAVSFDGPLNEDSSILSVETPKSDKQNHLTEYETCSNAEEVASAMVDSLQLKPESISGLKTGPDSSATGVFNTAEPPTTSEEDTEFFSEDQKSEGLENNLDKTPEKVIVTDATDGATTTNLVNNADSDLVIDAGNGAGAAGDLDEAIFNEENMRKVNEIYKQIKESAPSLGSCQLQRTQSMLTDVTVTNLSTYANASTSDVGDMEDLPDEGTVDESLPTFKGDRGNRQVGEDLLQFSAGSVPMVRTFNPSGAEMVTGLEDKESGDIEEAVHAMRESLTEVKEESTVVEEDTTGVMEEGEEEQEKGANTQNVEKSEEDNDSETEDRNSKVGVWNDILGTGALKKKILRLGYGEGTKPQKGEVVTVKYSLTRVDTGVKIVDDIRLDFVLGDCDVIDALDLGVQLMEMNEHCILFSSSRFAFGEKGYEPVEEKAETAHDLRGWPIVAIEPNIDVELDIELLNSKELPSDYALYTPEQLTDALQKKKEKGNFYSRRREWEKSMSGYNQALKVLLAAEEPSILPEEDVRTWKIVLYNNMAHTQLNTELFREAIVSCDFALEVDPQNVKALYRKAKALEGLGDTGDALEVIKAARRLDSRSKEITLCWEQLKEKHKQNQEKEKDVYRKMMEPMSSLADTDNQSKAAEQNGAKSSNSFTNQQTWFLVGAGICIGVAILATAFLVRRS